MFKFIAFLSVVILMNHCISNSSNTSVDCSGDPIIRDIPSNRRTISAIKIKEKVERLAGLSNIENGFNGLQIRIWFAYSSNIEHLILLTKNKDKWSGTLNTLKFNYHPVEDTLVSIHRTSNDVLPKSGWTVFTDSLINLGILRLPDMSSIPASDLSTDGLWFTVDFADCKTYRYYSYEIPWGDKSKNSQTQKVLDISNYIETELNFKRLGKP